MPDLGGALRNELSASTISDGSMPLTSNAWCGKSMPPIWPKALKTAKPALINAILKSVSKRAAESVREEDGYARRDQAERNQRCTGSHHSGRSPAGGRRRNYCRITEATRCRQQKAVHFSRPLRNVKAHRGTTAGHVHRRGTRNGETGKLPAWLH